MDEVRILIEDCGGLSIYGWFFGHEHRCTIYDDKARNPDALFRARLIGNGSIAHHPQEEVLAEKDDSQASTNLFLKVNSRALDEDHEVAVSTFALLTLDGPNIDVQYIDEDDRLFYQETWAASQKLW
jgi:hypothetical protein